jgi:hypothetical protein
VHYTVIGALGHSASYYCDKCEYFPLYVSWASPRKIRLQNNGSTIPIINISRALFELHLPRVYIRPRFIFPTPHTKSLRPLALSFITKVLFKPRVRISSCSCISKTEPTIVNETRNLRYCFNNTAQHVMQRCNIIMLEKSFIYMAILLRDTLDVRNISLLYHFKDMALEILVIILSFYFFTYFFLHLFFEASLMPLLYIRTHPHITITFNL